MKKTLAAFGASALGLAAAATGLATPAAAADVTTPCTDLSDHAFAADPLPDNFFLDCVPQYGLGKAEFTIVPSDTDATATFPVDFIDLEQPEVVATTTLDQAALAAYADGLEVPIFPAAVVESDEFHRTYAATVVAPVTSVAAVTEGNIADGVSDACDLENVDYGNGFVATYAPVDTTFTQTAGGREWVYVVTSTLKPSFFFATFDTTGGVDESEPWCFTDGNVTLASADSVPISPNEFFRLAYALPFTVVDQAAVVQSLGVFAPTELPVVPAQVLPETGVDATPLVVAAGSFAAFGAALLGFTYLVRRRHPRT